MKKQLLPLGLIALLAWISPADARWHLGHHHDSAYGKAVATEQNTTPKGFAPNKYGIRGIATPYNVKDHLQKPWYKRVFKIGN